MELYAQLLRQHQEYQQQVWNAQALEQQQQQLLQQHLLQQQIQQQQVHQGVTPLASAPNPAVPGPTMVINPPPAPEAKAHNEIPRKVSGWLERCVAYAVAYDQQLWARCEHLTQTFMQSPDFRHRFESHWENMRRWGKDARYDFK